MPTPQDLQNQLGLGLAVKQTQQQNNNPNYSFQEADPLSGGVKLSAGRALPTDQIDLGGGPSYYQAGVPNKSANNPVDPNLTATYAFTNQAAPASVSNVGIGDTFSGITPKKNKNIAESTSQVGALPAVTGVPSVPDSPTRDINEQKRMDNMIQRQTPLNNVPEVPAITPPVGRANGLQGAELQAYNQLTPQEQKTFDALAVQGIKAQTDYLQKSKATQEYEKGQEAIFQNADANKITAEDLQSQQQIAAAAKQVADLKQNIGYLGTGGQPGVSAAKLDAVSNQVALAQKTYQDVVKMDQLNKANRALGQESHTLQFTRQLQTLQDDLDSKVNKKLQGALNEFSSAELKGKLDTIPEIEAFQQQLYAQLDGDLSSIMDTNIEARKFLLERYDKLAESQKTQMAATEKAKIENEKRTNTVNKEMSQARGYFVNDNGDPVIDQTTGQRIVVPPESKTNYDPSTGEMIITTTNRDGTLSFDTKQVGAGKPDVAYGKIGTDANGEDIMGWIDKTNRTTSAGAQGTTGGQTSNVTPQAVSPQSIIALSDRLHGNNVQCGEVTNDYTKQAFPDAPRVGNSYESKLNTVQSIGVSPTPQVGGIFAMNTGSKTGHTGIVQSVNLQNGTFTATDANAQGLANGGPVKSSTYNIGPKTTFSVAPNTQKTEQAKTYSEPQKNVMDTIDPSNFSKSDNSVLTKNGLTRNDVIQYKADQKANSWTAGLDSKQITEANNIANTFYTTPVAQEFNTMQTALSSAKSFQNSKSNSTDQGLINVFAKAMDPGSSVKEGEYTTIQEYSQALSDKILGKIGRLYSTDGFLTQDAKDKMVDAISKKLSGNKEVYNNLRETYAKRIDSQTRNGIGEKAIPSAEIVTKEKPIYTDDSGKEYNMQQFKDELARAIKAGETTPEHAQEWLKQNNITLQ